ncbi:MAG: glycosyl hydrolase [Bacteroidia bacterium]
MRLSIILSVVFQFFPHVFIAQNILISDQNDPCEPSIMMNPNNTDILVAGSILNNVHRSNDGGITWTSSILSSSFGVWGDPVIDVDTSGHFYYFHLSNPPTGDWIDRIVCQKSTNNGATWNNGTGIGLVSPKEQDKQWSIVNRLNNHIYLTWTQFDEYGSTDPADSSIIRFSKSVDGGITWSEPIRISAQAGDCIDEDNTVEGSTPAIGPNGEIYVAWAGPQGIVFNKSLDEGETWLSEEILVNSMPGGWDYSIPGIQRANGFPVTKCDLSGGSAHGTIYINWTDQRNGLSNTDVWLSKSTDGGLSWSEALKVNDDTTNTHQFFTWMDIDQSTGKLYFIFYDRRNYPDTRTDVYMAISVDNGNSFINRLISESPFVPNSGIFFGDYTNITAHNDVVRPIWTRLNSGDLSIWTDVSPINEIITGKNEIDKLESSSIYQFPNPAKEISYVSFKLKGKSIVSLELFDDSGRLVHSLKKDEPMDYGKYIIPIYIDELGLPSGTYNCILSINNKSKNLRTVILD